MHDASRRSRQYGTVPREPDHWRFVAVGRMLVEVDPVSRVKPGGDRRRLAVGGQRPRQPLVVEIFRYLDRKDAVLTASIEVRGLAVVGTVRLDPIVGTDRNVQLLTLVAVVIPKQDQALAILVGPPSLEGREDRLAGCTKRLEDERRPGELGQPRRRDPREGNRDRRHQ